MQIKQSILLFDGFCNLCNGSVDFVMKHDKKNQFSYISLQSETAKKLLDDFKIPENTDSVVLIYSDKVYFESNAIIQILKLLNYPWKLGIIVKIVPAKMRNKVYNWIAKNRYKWFGKRKTCRII